MTEEENDKWYMLGRVAGREEVVEGLKDRAAGLFRGHNDKEAQELRSYATYLELSTKQLRKDYDKKYPKQDISGERK